MERKFLHNKPKFFMQLAIVLLILVLVISGLLGLKKKTDFESVCPLGGILSLGSKLYRGSMSCAMSETQVFMGIMLVIGVILFSKLFCGYLCPIGTVSEWLSKLVSRWKAPYVLRGVLDRILRLGKYVLLFFTAYYTITKSELWCKKFDPYFASVTGFGSDTVLWAGLLAIGAVVVISLFIRFFWCKYVCPLNALSNIFTNILITAPLILIYLVLYLLGIKLNILWLILALCLAGAITEMWRYKFFSLRVVPINNNKETCTACEACDASCPQGIPVSEYQQVDHPDCTLCLDCVKSCPNGSITVGKTKGTWLPPVVIIGLVALGFLFAKQFEFKTLSERWGGYDSLQTVASLKFEPLRSVKCYGSSKSLANKLVRVKGIVGLDTYAKSHKVVVYYDTTRLTPLKVKQAVFTPYQYKLSKFQNYQPANLAVYEVPVNGLWDIYDNINLIRLLMVDTAIVGLETNFGEPVHAKIFFDLGKVTTERINELIEQPYCERKTPDGKVEKIKVNFKVEGKGAVIDTMDYVSFRKAFFSGYDQKFNNYEKYNPQQLSVFEVSLPDAENIGVRRALKYLTSHVSVFDGTVRLRTTYTDRPVVQIFFDKKQVSPQQIWEKLQEAELQVFSGDEIKKMSNEFQFEGPYKVYPYDPKMEDKPKAYQAGTLVE